MANEATDCGLLNIVGDLSKRRAELSTCRLTIPSTRHIVILRQSFRRIYHLIRNGEGLTHDVQVLIVRRMLQPMIFVVSKSNLHVEGVDRNQGPTCMTKRCENVWETIVTDLNVVG